MGVEPIFDREVWERVPFHFWSLVFFSFGCIVGSFLNVVIHRLPIGESVVSPPSHCPHCKYSIPWWLNVPLFTWLWLRGKCANCKAPIAPRYFFVELLTGVAFLGCWLAHGQASVLVALVYCLVLAGFIASSAIDFEHMIIPDELTLGGVVVGFACSALVPALHDADDMVGGMVWSLVGVGAGAGVIYGVLRAGKLAFGRQKLTVEPGTKVVLGENSLQLPGEEIPYEELFYRKSDQIVIHGKRVELVDRGYPEATVRLSPVKLRVDDDEFAPENVPHLEAECSEVVVPREAMGFGDVKFMAAIGAFLGWKATLFALMASSVAGAVVGVALILAGKKEWSSRLPYGPYIAFGAILWIFGGKTWLAHLWAVN